jgi:hypothetical protein
MKLRGRIYLFLFMLLPLFSGAQIDDVGLWLGASVEKKITRNAEVLLGEQLRFNHDITTVDVLLTDAGIEYNVLKDLKVGFHYRFIQSNQDNYYSKRHRFYVNLAYKYKISFLTLTLRERIQEQYNDIYSSENGKIPIWILRSKLTAKFDLDKKYTPYISGEMYYILDNAKEEDHYISRFRYEAGISYEFNRVHSVNPFILYQQDHVTGFTELIYGITYGISL